MILKTLLRYPLVTHRMAIIDEKCKLNNNFKNLLKNPIFVKDLKICFSQQSHFVNSMINYLDFEKLKM